MPPRSMRDGFLRYRDAVDYGDYILEFFIHTNPID